MTNITLFSETVLRPRGLSSLSQHYSYRYPIEINRTSKISVEKGLITPAPLAP